MKDTDSVPHSDILTNIPKYNVEFGWPTFADIKPYLPSYYDFLRGWELWDPPNKSAVIFKWHDKRAGEAAAEADHKHYMENLRKYEAEEKQKQELEEEQRLIRVATQKAKLEDESARRAHGAAVVAQQTACSERKRVDAQVDEANEYIAGVHKLVAALRGIPASRLHEVDTDALFYNCGRVKKIIEPTFGSPVMGSKVMVEQSSAARSRVR